NSFCLVLLLLNFSAATHFQTQPSNSSSTFCFWTKSISNGRTSYMFLHRTHSRSGETSLVLFDSIWTKDNTLVDCVTSSNQVVTKSYVSQCWEPGATIFSRIPDERFNVSKLVDPAGPCEGTVGRLAHPRQSVRRRSRDLESVDRQDGETLSGESSGQKSRRSKRAWIVPGTLWCGAGHSALDFTELGLYVNTDMCCREHDHCKDSITSFGFNYGVLNTNIFTLSHCDCDKKFQQCLHKANDSMANVVGYGYFNVLKMRCFEFAERMECAERTWWGMCKFHQMAKYALVRDATYYNSTSPELEEETSAVYTTSAGQPTATPGSTVPSTLPTEDPRADREHPETTDSYDTWLYDFINALIGVCFGTHCYKCDKCDKRVIKVDHVWFVGKVSTCESYKDLDSCRLQIPGKQEKFGLRNAEFATLYHCNCTTVTVELSNQFSGLDRVDDVHFFLLDFVSQFCFILPPNCTDSDSCSSKDPPVIRRWTKDVAGGRPLVASKRKAKRLNSKRSKRKDSFRLYKKCLRMHSKLQRPKEPTDHKLQNPSGHAEPIKQ
uniref:phospholipase A2 n=1 Tax=Astyanax mexicanus TaxID=7994 RepID=A0A8B9H0N0_ASTMX